MKQEEKPKRRKLERSDNVIPDYDHLFEETASKNGKKGKSFFGKILKANVKPMIGTTLIYLIQATPIWMIPIITANIINLVTDAINVTGVTENTWRTLIISAVVLFVLILQNVPMTKWRNITVSRMVRRTSAGIKSAVVRKLQSLSITYHKDMQTGKIQSKFLKDTEAIDGLFNNLVHGIIPSAITIIVSTTISVVNNGLVSLFFLLIIPCDVLLSYAFRKKIKRTNRDYRIKTENLSSKMHTMLEMLPVTKSHGLERVEIESVNKEIKRLAGSGHDVDRTIAVFGAWAWVINILLSSVCLVFCAVLALNGIIKVGDIVLYQSMFSQISGAVSSLTNLVPAFGSGIEALSSVSEIMNATDVEANIGKTKIPAIKGQIEFKDVCYKYPNTDQYVVSNFSLDVKPGECIAVVGASGSGKSTIMNLIIGFLVPNQGQVLVDGKPLTEFNLSEYRHHISVVPQNSILFAGSIKENITYGLERYSDEDLSRVVEMANLNEFIKDLPYGINTDIGEHGDKLSGGQRQRITIARALIRNPSILILDEATSALDNISEYHVQKAIASSIKGRTTFIVAHRLSTIRDADRIVVMEQGVAVEIGTYDELMAKKGKFYELKALNEMNLKSAEEGLN